MRPMINPQQLSKNKRPKSQPNFSVAIKSKQMHPIINPQQFSNNKRPKSQPNFSVALKSKQMRPMINPQQLSKNKRPKYFPTISTPSPQVSPLIAVPSSKANRLIFKVKILQALLFITAQSHQSEHLCMNCKRFLLKVISLTKKMSINRKKTNGFNSPNHNMSL